jgi:hypothetical protein
MYPRYVARLATKCALSSCERHRVATGRSLNTFKACVQPLHRTALGCTLVRLDVPVQLVWAYKLAATRSGPPRPAA